MNIFLDLETTGVEKIDRLCSVAMITDEISHCELINPEKKVPPSAMAVHHITNEMLQDKLTFEQSKTAELLLELNSTQNVLIGHNIGFDIDMLSREGSVWQGGFIDTLKCTRELIGSEIEQFSLQFLRYELRLHLQERDLAKRLGVTIQAHNALSDAMHVKMLYEYLLGSATHEELMRISVEPVLILKLPFGKYRGRFIEDVARRDEKYLNWMLNSLSDLDEDLRYSIKHYLVEVKS